MARLLDLRAARVSLRQERATALSKPRATAYSGAAHNRLTSDWIFAGLRSADQEVRGDIKTLRKRAREMARNNPHARRFKSLLAEHVIGPHGVKLQATVERPDGARDETINDRIEDAWRAWGRKGNCTADRKLSFVEVSQLYMETLGTDGEVLLRILPGFKNDHGFAVQLLDADFLDEEYNRPAGEGKPEIRMGVEMDEWGAPLAYHIWSHHPHDAQNAKKRQRLRVPAEQIIHDYLHDRPGQTRGVTWFAPVLFRAHMLHAFEEAAVTAARIGASTVGWFIPGEDAAPSVGPGGESEEITMDAEPGGFGIGPRGHTLEQFNPHYPSIEFGEFSKALLRSIAAGLRTSYNLLASDLEGVSYSSLREGKISEREVWKLLQQRFIETVLERIYPLWLKWAMTTGALELPMRNVGRWQSHIWQPRGWDWVDPLKDIAAETAAIRENLTSKTRVCAARGLDYHEILRERKREREAEEKAGVLPAETAPARPIPEGKDREEDGAHAFAYDLLYPPHTNGNGNRVAAALNGKEDGGGNLD